VLLLPLLIFLTTATCDVVSSDVVVVPCACYVISNIAATIASDVIVVAAGTCACATGASCC